MSDCSLLIPHILVYAQKETCNPHGLDKSAEPGEQTDAGEQSGSWEAGVLSRYEQGVRNRCLKLCSNSPSTPRWCCAISNLLVSFCRCHFVFLPTFDNDTQCVWGWILEGKNESHTGEIGSQYHVCWRWVCREAQWSHNVNSALFFVYLVSAFYNSCFPKCNWAVQFRNEDHWLDSEQSLQQIKSKIMNVKINITTANCISEWSMCDWITAVLLISKLSCESPFQLGVVCCKVLTNHHTELPDETEIQNARLNVQ